MVDKKEKTENKILVVAQLPTQATRQVVDESGITYDCVTTDEALTEILTLVRSINSKVG